MPPIALPAILSAEIIEIALPLRRPYVSGATNILQRDLLLIRLTTETASGWGEAAPIPGYSLESHGDCRTWLASAAEDLLAGEGKRSGPAAGQFAVDAALADLAARTAGKPLWRSLGGVRDRVEVGAVIGIDVPMELATSRAIELVDAGYRRIKLKIDPASGYDRVASVRAALPHHDLAVDANGTFSAENRSLLAAFDELDLSFIEQPFPAGDLEGHAKLAADIATPVCLDESISDLASARRCIEAGAVGAINIKPSRVGGLDIAIAIHDLALAAGIPAWCGGMLESGFGKASALAVASLPGMTLPADLPPSNRHYESDLIESPWEMEGGSIALPGAPGSGVHPDWNQIDQYTVAVATFGDPVGLRR